MQTRNLDTPNYMTTTTIIGAGIIGLSTAIWLARKGHNVRLVDQGDITRAASFGNGGILASCSMIPVMVPGMLTKAPRMLLSEKEPLFINWSYLPRMLPWLMKYASRANIQDTTTTSKALNQLVSNSLKEHQLLSADTNAAECILPSDYLYIYNSREDFLNDSFAWELRASYGILWQELGSRELSQYDNSFSQTAKFAIQMKNHGHIDNLQHYLQCLLQHAKALGVEYIQGNYEAAALHKDQLESVIINGQAYATHRLVITAGARSKSIAKHFGINASLETERGYHLDLINPNITLKAPVMITDGKFIINPMKDRLRLAGIVEFGGFEAKSNEKAINLLRNSVKQALPQLRWETESAWLGHRPATSDSIPLIGEIPNHPGVYCAFGHHHIGLTSGPKTGRLLAQLINDEQPDVDLMPYAVNRFN
jgi:D-amino-acid dehydrogenase